MSSFDTIIGVGWLVVVVVVVAMHSLIHQSNIGINSASMTRRCIVHVFSPSIVSLMLSG